MPLIQEVWQYIGEIWWCYKKIWMLYMFMFYKFSQHPFTWQWFRCRPVSYHCSKRDSCICPLWAKHAWSIHIKCKKIPFLLNFLLRYLHWHFVLQDCWQLYWRVVVWPPSDGSWSPPGGVGVEAVFPLVGPWIRASLYAGSHCGKIFMIKRKCNDIKKQILFICFANSKQYLVGTKPLSEL